MMTNAQLATASLDDIVFDGRNRVYGAYELRALYQRHMTRALVIATVLCALLLVFPLVAQLLRNDVLPVPPTIVEAEPGGYTLPEVPEVQPPPAAAARPPVVPPQPPTVKDVVPVVVADKAAPKESEVPNQDELLENAPGARTAAGDPNAKPDDFIEVKPGPSDGTAAAAVPAAPYTFVEQMPELPGGGGQLAIVAAIQRAVRYPGLALRNGVEGKIYVSFTVNPKGEVVDAKIVQGLGSGLDEETLRAINTLPRFIPGKQNGREVSVSFTVPVTYRIQ